MDFTGLLKSDQPAFLNLRFAADLAFLFEANRKTKEPAGKRFVHQAKPAHGRMARCARRCAVMMRRVTRYKRCVAPTALVFTEKLAACMCYVIGTA
jgi:hypothetical protein